MYVCMYVCMYARVFSCVVTVAQVADMLKKCGTARRQGRGATSPDVWREYLVTLRQQLAVLESGALALPPNSITLLAGRVDAMISLVSEQLEGTEPTTSPRISPRGAPAAAETLHLQPIQGGGGGGGGREAPSSGSPRVWSGTADFGAIADAVVLRRLIGVICGPTDEPGACVRVRALPSRF